MSYFALATPTRLPRASHTPSSSSSITCVAPSTATHWPLTNVRHGVNACASSSPPPTTGMPAFAALRSVSRIATGP